MNTTRRRFLGGAACASTMLALAPGLPGLVRRAAAAAETGPAADGPTSLVLVRLSGGNDGLNCVVPYADDVYARSRTTLRLGARDVLKIDDRLGFHPAMTACRRLYDDGLFGVLQGVGYPKSSRNHPEAERDWSTARPGDTAVPTGWVGRYADTCGPASAPAVFVGPIAPPMAIRAERAIVSPVRAVEDLALRAAPEDAPASRGGADERGNALLGYVRGVHEAALGASRKVRAAAAATPAGRFPATQFAQRLRAVASLIRADVGIRVHFTELGGDGFGGFDNHANQKENHAALLAQFSDGVGAFIDDLRRDGLARRVLLMTVSEFGRTFRENGRHGTGHGAAAPVFVAGGRIKGGMTGPHPDLGRLDNDAPPCHTDFRRVFATVLRTWLGADADAVLGASFEPVEFLA